jgi:hypothetical protein
MRNKTILFDILVVLAVLVVLMTLMPPMSTAASPLLKKEIEISPV